MRLAKAKAIANVLVLKLLKHNGITAIKICGSIRRKKKKIKDIDIVIAAYKNVNINWSNLGKVLWEGKKKIAILYKRIHVDFRICHPDEFQSMCLYLTGNSKFNRGMRSKAKDAGMKLNEYGLWNRKTEELIENSEKEIFKCLGMKYILPKDRGRDKVRFVIVKSKSLKGVTYRVEKDIKGKWNCTCPGYMYHDTECKHIEEVKENGDSR